METRKRGAPKKAANGKKAGRPVKKRTKSEPESHNENGFTSHLEDKVTVALPHENGGTHNLDDEQVKITKPTVPKMTEHQHLDALLFPSSDIPAKPQQASSSSGLVTFDDALPIKYKHLEQCFNALINVYLYLQARQQSCTWSLMKEPIESMCNEKLNLSDLSQIQTVIPNAVKLSVWKHSNTNKLGRELAVEIVSPTTSQPLNHSISSQLRQTFHENLTQLLNQHHTTFLSKGKLKAPKPPARFHSKFDIESVPDIPLTPLPSELTEAPQQENAKEPEKLDIATIEKYIDAKPVPSELAGISAATIAQARETEDAVVNENEELTLVRRLPTVVRTIHSLCVSEKKRAFKKDHLLAQMVSCSASPLSPEEAAQAVNKLVQLIPQWASAYVTDGAEWVRFSREVTVATCLGVIQQEIQKINVH